MENGAPASNALDILAAWREQGADRLNPVRFHFIEALSRRTAAQGGHARRVLDGKLAKLLDAYARDVAAASDRPVALSETMSADTAAPAINAAAPVARRPLADLLQRLSGLTCAPGDDVEGGQGQSRSKTSDSSSKTSDSVKAAVQLAYPDLALLDYFRDTWSRYSAKRQLKQSGERVPENAGPLNSSLLVHRTLSLMREVSPEYLRYFLSYVDALAWAEQATGGDLLNKDTQRAGGARKSARGTSR